MNYLIYFLYFGFPLILVGVIYFFFQRKASNKALDKLAEAQAAGLTEPASLHPSIDPNVCLGCATCVSACPEGEILGLIKRKAVLVSPSSCIGHGACKEACPTHAITLVFGSETRGIEIPMLNSNFESSVPDIFIAGELGGMGLIKNAITQGQQAVTAIAKKKRAKEMDYDLIIIGAGPAGLSAALAAQDKKLRYLVLEQDTIGGAVAHYPRGKIAMTRPAVLPIVGKFQFREASKEALVEFWNSVVQKTRLNIQTGKRVEAITKIDGGFQVDTQNKHISCNTVLLAMGRRGTPRKLEVQGEELSKVVYRLIDAEQYKNQHVLVVGGGDSALEAALAISGQEGTHTTLSYRSAAFSRVKQKNRERIENAAREGKIKLLLESTVKTITNDKVSITIASGNNAAKDISFRNDSVIVCAGGILPTPFLKKIGIEVEEKFGTV